MASAISTITVEFRWRWWVPYYVRSLVLFCRTFGTTPDLERCTWFICRRGVVMTIGGRRV